MLWQSLDRLNVVTLDETIAEQIGEYLDNKEAQLSSLVSHLTHSLESTPGLASGQSPSYTRLNEAVEDFSRKIQRITQERRTVDDGQFYKVVRDFNLGLWRYVEVLEGCVTELFQQLDQIGFEQWNVDFVRALTAIKDELTHRIDDVTWAIRRLNEQFKRYKYCCGLQGANWLGFHKLFFGGERYLDKTVEPALRKCNKFLNFRYRKFIDRYAGYQLISDSIEKQLQKSYNYRVLSALDIDAQDKYKQLFFLLHLWEQNHKTRTVSRSEPVRALRSFATAQTVVTILKEYFSQLKKSVFEGSRLIKKQFRLLFLDKSVRQPLIDNLSGYRSELATLNSMVDGYKKFHVQTDPSIRKGFFCTTKNNGNEGYKHLMAELDNLSHEIKGLDLLVVNFHASLECEPALENKVDVHVEEVVAGYIHEMEQPLASRDLMRKDAKALLNVLHGLDEMGAFDPLVVSFTRWTLILAMCADWKYHVLQDLSLFHHIYHLHQNIVGNNEDRSHLNRLQRFNRVFERVRQWVGANQTVKHAHDIELDINDIKAYLQDFFAHVQRIEKGSSDIPDGESAEDPIARAEQALLEYLYIFGGFLHTLSYDNLEHRQIRRQLLFVDQYFEEIRRKLQDLKEKK